MIRIEALTLEEAYQKASTELSCSISNLQYEVIQYPSSGILGFLKKSAIIVASCDIKEEKDTKEENIDESKSTTTGSITKTKKIRKVSTEETPKVEDKPKSEPVVVKDDIVDSFFDADKIVKVEKDEKSEPIVYDELAVLIETQLKEMLSKSCFGIDVVEVDVRDNTALIFLDGDDAALLIGKEGYRYNALSYMLFNWLHSKYELFIKLEIAEFLTTQQDMITNYMKPVIENVEKNGKGKTRFLDGILVQIALEQLRERFPNKYVAVKTSKTAKNL